MASDKQSPPNPGEVPEEPATPRMQFKPRVAIIMGSRSDWATMQHSADTLAELGLLAEIRIVSAHRTPDLLFDFAEQAESRGIEVIIAGAGGAAHLPGTVSPRHARPCWACRLRNRRLRGVDSLLSIVQMPRLAHWPSERRCGERRLHRGGDSGSEASRRAGQAQGCGQEADTDDHGGPRSTSGLKTEFTAKRLGQAEALMLSSSERDRGVEPLSQPWEGWARPIYQSRNNRDFNSGAHSGQAFSFPLDIAWFSTSGAIRGDSRPDCQPHVMIMRPRTRKRGSSRANIGYPPGNQAPANYTPHSRDSGAVERHLPMR